jgi:hypothetical protein
MYARVSTSVSPKEKMDEIAKLMRETIWPATKKHKGYKGYLTLRNPETGEGMTISIWDTEADMLASEKAFYPQAVKQATATGVKPGGMKHYVVGIKD